MFFFGGVVVVLRNGRFQVEDVFFCFDELDPNLWTKSEPVGTSE